MTTEYAIKIAVTATLLAGWFIVIVILPLWDNHVEPWLKRRKK